MNFIRYRLKKIASLSLLVPAIANFLRIVKAGKGRGKIIVALTQHLGDNIAAEPLDSFIRSQNPDQFIIRIVGKSFVAVVSRNPAFDQFVTVSCLSEWVYLKPMLLLLYPVIDLHVHKSFDLRYRLSISNPNRFGINDSNYYNHGNLLQVFCQCAGFEKLDLRPFYQLPANISVSDLPERMAIIHVTSNNEQREWENDKWKVLIDCLGKNKGLTIVEVGLKSSLNCTLPNYKDFCGRLSFDEIAFAISSCKLFVGIDSAFAHFANAFNVPRVILLGHFNSYTYYLPYSGNSEQEVTLSVIHHKGPVKEILVETVIDKIDKWQIG